MSVNFSEKEIIKKVQGESHPLFQIYMNLYNESPDLYRTINTDGIIVVCNKSYAKNLGYSKKEVIGKSIFEHVAEQSLQALRKSFDEWKERGTVSSMEISLMRKDGTTFPVLLSTTNLLDDKGDLVGNNTVMRDISELRQTERKFRSLYEESPDLHRSINTNGIIIDCNKKYAQELGYSKEEIIGKSIFDFCSERSLEPTHKLFEKWKKTERVLTHKSKLMRKDGTSFPVLISATSLYNADGTLIGSNTIIKNISQIEEIERKYRSLYENSPDLYRTINKEGIILNCNKSYAEHLGYTKKEIIGKSIFEHISKEGESEMRDSFETWKKTGRVLNREVRLKRKDGTTFPALISANNLYDAAGELVGSDTNIRDITEMYNAQKAVQEKQRIIIKQYEELKKLDLAKSEFMYMTSHELKTPLVPIKSYTDMLLSGKFGSIKEEQRKALKTVMSNTDSLLRLVSDLLDIQKIELGKLKLDKKIYDLSKIITLSVSNIKPIAKKQNISITTDLQENIFCSCDKTRIEQVLSNLISNAIKYTKKNGKIHVKLDSNSFNAKVVVKDNGAGIQKEKLDEIFIKFYQIDSSLTRETGGTGLGLSVCKGIIENHDGKIWAESEGRDKGIEIHILLPLDSDM